MNQMVEGRRVGRQNDRGLILAMDHLAKDVPGIKEDFEKFLLDNSFDRKELMNSHSWGPLNKFNELINGCAAIILKHRPQTKNPYSLLGSLVYLFWEFLMVKLINALRILRSPGDVYDKIKIYTKMFNDMRVIEVIHDWMKISGKISNYHKIIQFITMAFCFIFGGKDSRIIRDTLDSNIDASEEDPSSNYIHGRFPFDHQRYGKYDIEEAGILGSIPRLIWGLPNAEVMDPVLVPFNILTYLSQDKIYPQFGISACFSASGDLIIGQQIYGKIVELESEPVAVEVEKDDETEIVMKYAFLGKKKETRVRFDELDPELLRKGKMQLDGRQLGVLITCDLYTYKSKNTVLTEEDRRALESLPANIRTLVSDEEEILVLKTGDIFNTPYYVIKYSFLTPNIATRLIQLIQASGEFNGKSNEPDFAELKGFWNKFFRIFFSGKKAFLLPIILGRTIYGMINDTNSVMEQEIVLANLSRRDMETMGDNLEKEHLELIKAHVELQVAKQETEDALSDIIVVLGKAIEARDSYTEGHTSRVSEYALGIGQELGLSYEELEELRQAAYMHDVGKIGIEDDILRKPGQLDDDEFKIMQQHPEIGYKILSEVRSPRFKRIAQIIAAHHENLDGTGYPFKLKDDEIVVLALVIKAADIYDALTTDRPYRKGMDANLACKIMLEEQIVGLCVSTDIFFALIKTVNPDFLKSEMSAKTCLNMYHGILKGYRVEKQYPKDPEKYKKYALELLGMIQPDYIGNHPGCLDAPT